MKYLYSLLLLAIACLPSTAQSEGFEALIEQIKLHASTNPELMQREAEQALEMAGEDPNMLGQVHLEYGNLYYYMGDYVRADSVFQQVITLALEADNSVLEYKAKIRRAAIMGERGQNKEAEEILRGYLPVLEENEDYANLVDGLNIYAQTKEGRYQMDSTLFYYTKAIGIAREQGLDYQHAYLLNNIGLFKFDLEEYDGALEHFTEGYEYCLRTNNARLRAHIANNLGLSYLRNKDYEASRKYFGLFLSDSKAAGAIIQVGMGYLNIGGVYYQEEKYEESIAYYDSAMTAFVTAENPLYVPRTLGSMARVRVAVGDYNLAIQLADSTLAMAKERQLLQDELLAQIILSRAYDSLGNAATALEHYRIVNDLSDSLKELTFANSVAEMETRYDVKEKEFELAQTEAENQLLEKEQALSQWRMNVIIVLAVAAILTILILMYLRQVRISKREQELYSQKQLQNIEAERNKIARELHDDLGQTLSMIRNKIELHKTNSEATDYEQLNEALGNVIESTRQISQSLYPTFLKKLSTSEALERLMERTEQNTDLVCSSEISSIDPHINDDQKLHLYRIIQECINNTVKHAKATAIKLQLQAYGSEIVMEYKDNGVGISSKKKLQGMGMMSIAERIRIMNGTLELGSSKGFSMRVRIKQVE